LQALKDAGCDRILLFPLYPQYAAATTATVCDKAFETLLKLRDQPTLRVVPPYYAEPVYIEALASSLEAQTGVVVAAASVGMIEIDDGSLHSTTPHAGLGRRELVGGHRQFVTGLAWFAGSSLSVCCRSVARPVKRHRAPPGMRHNQLHTGNFQVGPRYARKHISGISGTDDPRGFPGPLEHQRDRLDHRARHGRTGPGSRVCSQRCCHRVRASGI
jgi:hypothetical protein